MIWTPFLQVARRGALAHVKIDARKGTTSFGGIFANLGSHLDLALIFAVQTVDHIVNDERLLGAARDFMEVGESGEHDVVGGNSTAAVEVVTDVLQARDVEHAIKFVHVGLSVGGVADVDVRLLGEWRASREHLGVRLL